MHEIIRDDKENASRTFADVAEKTRNNFPESAYRLRVHGNGRVSGTMGRHRYFAGADGTGTKPELAERMDTLHDDPCYYEGLGSDVVAMVADDVPPLGYFVVGIVNTLDVNSAKDSDFVAALARGMHRACDKGRFPLLNGETAELGYRTPGVGKNHLNWNAVALQLVNEAKIIDGSKLKAGNIIIGLRERSIRSNGLTMARDILENAWLQERSFQNKRAWAIHAIQKKQRHTMSAEAIGDIFDAMPGGPAFLDHVHVPWHEQFREVTEQLLTPSKIYAPLFYEAQGGVDGPVNIPLLACAHITGGGVPLKVQRMLKDNPGLGVDLNTVFPDPDGIPKLMELSRNYGVAGKTLIDDRTACEKWNRGVGVLCVVESDEHAAEFVGLAAKMDYEAAIMGSVIDHPLIRWRGHEWSTQAVSS
ncbi:hypothetical protein HZA87_02375 [Candidatus Uhrbacteria bacterium]|nr:hypothetical protein [Candidatus Uhrbacteria bacterium]